MSMSGRLKTRGKKRKRKQGEVVTEPEVGVVQDEPGKAGSL